NGTHLLSLINDVLDLSKINSGQMRLVLDTYSMKSIVESVVATTMSLAQTKGLVLSADVPSDLPAGNGDERCLRQVLLNLVTNAIKFTDAGTVCVRVHAVNDDFNILVSDTGSGIPPEFQSQIFEDFVQVDNSITRQKGGTGLGLSISRHLVE